MRGQHNLAPTGCFIKRTHTHVFALIFSQPRPPFKFRPNSSIIVKCINYFLTHIIFR